MRKLLILVIIAFPSFQANAQKHYNDVDTWLSALKSNDKKIQTDACYALRLSVKDTFNTVLTLLHELKGDNQLLIKNIAFVLGEYRLLPKLSISALVTLLRKNYSEDVMGNVALALSKFGKDAVPPLLLLLREQPPPISREPDCYYPFSLPAAYAAIALIEIGKPTLDAVKPESDLQNYWHSRSLSKYMSSHLIDNLSNSERANYYGVLKPYMDMCNTVLVDTSLVNLYRRNMARNKFLHDKAFEIFNDTLKLSVSIKIIKHLIEKFSNAEMTDLINNLSINIIKRDSLFSSLAELISKSRNITLLKALNQKVQDGMKDDEDLITVNLHALNQFSALLQNKNRDLIKRSLALLSKLRPDNKNNIDINAPVLNSLIKITKISDVAIQEGAYKVLGNYVIVPEVKQHILNGIGSDNKMIAIACLCASDNISNYDSDLIVACLKELPKKPIDFYTQDQTQTFNEIAYELLIKRIGKLDTSAATLVIDKIVPLLEDTVYLPKIESAKGERFLGLIFQSLLKMGAAGMKRASKYISHPDNRYPLSLASVIDDGYRTIPNSLWFEVVQKLLIYQNVKVQTVLLKQLSQIKLGPPGYILLEPLLKKLDDLPNLPLGEKPEADDFKKLWQGKEGLPQENILKALASIGDTIIPKLVENYTQNSHSIQLLELLLSYSCNQHPLITSVLNKAVNSSLPKERIIAFKHLSSCPLNVQQYLQILRADFKNKHDKELIITSLKAIQTAGSKASMLKKDLVEIINNPHQYFDSSHQRDYEQHFAVVRIRKEALFALINTSIIDTAVKLEPNKGWLNSFFIEEREPQVVVVGNRVPKLPISDTIVVNELIKLTGDNDQMTKSYAYKFLGLLDSASPVIEGILIKGLYNQHLEVSTVAAQAILGLEIAPEKYGSLITKALNDSYIEQYIDNAFSYIREVYSKGCMFAPPILPETFPQLTWPPAPSSTRDIIPANLFSKESNLGQVYSKLTTALKRCNYDEYKIFEVKDGFALLTKLERIKKDGSPYNEERWTRQQLTPISISEYIKSLFWGAEGHFRVFLFAVTSMAYFPDNGKPLLKPNSADDLFRQGSAVLPKEIAILPFTNMYVHALVYQFYKKDGGEANILYNLGEVIPTMKQLTATHIIDYLSR
jgi:hypothetical protein